MLGTALNRFVLHQFTLQSIHRSKDNRTELPMNQLCSSQPQLHFTPFKIFQVRKTASEEKIIITRDISCKRRRTNRTFGGRSSCMMMMRMIVMMFKIRLTKSNECSMNTHCYRRQMKVIKDNR